MVNINLCTIYERGARFTLFIGLFVKMFARSCNRRCILASLCTAYCMQSCAKRCKKVQMCSKRCKVVQCSKILRTIPIAPLCTPRALIFLSSQNFPPNFGLRMRNLLSLQWFLDDNANFLPKMLDHCSCLNLRFCYKMH